jgi:hypothetical protein
MATAAILIFFNQQSLSNRFRFFGLISFH